MASDDTAILRIKILYKKDVIGWFLHQSKTKSTFADILQDVFDGQNPCVNNFDGLDFKVRNFNVKCTIKEEVGKEVWSSAPLVYPLDGVWSGRGSVFLKYEVEVKNTAASVDSDSDCVEQSQACQGNHHQQDEPSCSSWKDIFKGAHSKHLPGKIEEPIRGTQRLWNALVDYLQAQEVGWFADEVEGIGRGFLKEFRNTLWLLDGHHKTLTDRGATQLPDVVQQQFSGFNVPEEHKHVINRLTQQGLLSASSRLYEELEKPWMSRASWKNVKQLVESVASCMVSYATYLTQRVQRDADRHSAEAPLRSPATSSETYPLKCNPNLVLSTHWHETLRPIVSKLTNADDWDPVYLNDLLPSDRSKRFKMLEFLKKNGFSNWHVCIYSYASGCNLGNQHFIWKESSQPGEFCLETAQQRSSIIAQVQKNISTYHTRQMKATAREKLTLLLPAIKPRELRAIYRLFTGDAAVPSNQITKDMDKRLQVLLENADEEIVVDLRKNNGRPPSFDSYWDIVDTFLLERTAVDDRRHDNVTSDGDVVTHVAMAMSMSDLYRQINDIAKEKGLNTETEIPTLSWFRLQFWPKNPYQRSALHYTGRFKVKSMVQQRQLRKAHVDAHYAAAVYRYQREFAVTNREHCLFLSLDDKCKVPIGEPGYPIAAVTRGKQVIVGVNQVMQVGDHDFSRMSFIPSVALLHDIPETIDGSFYRGSPHVGIKFTVTEGSTSYRHMRELGNFPQLREGVPPILCLYTDGGPDHNVTHLSVKLSLIAFFIAHDLDVLIAVRTAAGHSFRNPAERMNAIINLALQSIGVVRQKLEDDTLEKEVRKRNNLTALRSAVNSNENMKDQLTTAVKPAKDLLQEMIGRCKLKENNFTMYEPASTDEVNALFESIHEIDPAVTMGDKMSDLKNRPKLKMFLEHCCRSRTYSFTIKKCGEESCEICKGPRMEAAVFQGIHHLPDPIPDQSQEHYMPFEDLYGKPEMEDADEKFLPQKSEKSSTGIEMPFGATIQHAKTVTKCISCTECSKPRVMYAAKKVRQEQQAQLDRVLDGYLYTCGAKLQELIPDHESPDHEVLDFVYVRGNLRCSDAVEGPYFGVPAFPQVCAHCGDDNLLTSHPGKYPICQDCVSAGKAALLKRGKRNNMERGN